MIDVAEGPNACHQWKGRLSKRGYPVIGAGGKTLRVQRVIFEMYIRAIPEGYVIHHRCRNPSCVNVLHLEALSIEDHKAKHRQRYNGKDKPSD